MTSRVRRLATIVAATLLGLLVVSALGWRMTGGRWLVVSTPSMGTAAPVGTLVLTRPVKVAQLHVGDIVTYRPPGSTGRTFTHRVVSLTADGGVHTRGDINGAVDPWVVHDRDLVGRVVAHWSAVGWLVRALPLLLIGCLVVWGATHWYAPARWKRPLRNFGYSATLSLAAATLKPFVGAVVLTSSADGSVARAQIVSTGILPIRVWAVHGSAANLRTGQVGSVATTQLNSSGHYALGTSLHMGWPWWAALVTALALPLLWTLIVGVPADQLDATGATTGPTGSTSTTSTTSTTKAFEVAPA